MKKIFSIVILLLFLSANVMAGQGFNNYADYKILKKLAEKSGFRAYYYEGLFLSSTKRVGIFYYGPHYPIIMNLVDNKFSFEEFSLGVFICIFVSTFRQNYNPKDINDNMLMNYTVELFHIAKNIKKGEEIKIPLGVKVIYNDDGKVVIFK